MTQSEENNESKARLNERWKKIGLIGFLLFLLKGIIWLVVGYLILG